MKTVTLKEMRLQNYKCYSGDKMHEFNLGDSTVISGKNASGKSTLYNAYLEILTGKQADGTAPDGIRPCGADGRDLNEADVIRGLTIEVDGVSTEIKKTTKQNWRTPRGGGDRVFDGNSTEYEVDGFPVKSKEYEEQLSNIAPVEMLNYCSSPMAFINLLRKSTADGRKMLEKIAGFDLGAFVREHSEYAHVAELTKGHSVEDVLKKLRKQLTSQKKLVETKQTEIKYESARTTEGMTLDTSGMEKEIDALLKRQKALEKDEKALDEYSIAYDKKAAEIANLKAQKASYERQLEQAERANRAEFMQKASALRSKLDDLKLSHQRGTSHKLRVESEANEYKQSLDGLTAKWMDMSKAEYVPENTSCPLCGRKYTKAMLDSGKEKFEKKKADALAAIADTGKGIKTSLDKCKTELEEQDKVLERLEKEIETVGNQLKEVEASAVVPAADNKGDSKALAAYDKKIAKSEAELAGMDNGADKRRAIREELMKASARINELRWTVKQKEQAESERTARLNSMKNDLRQLAQTQADIERDIDSLLDFSRAKNEALAEKVNPYMKDFSFVLSDTTIEGNPYDTCRLVKNGVDYADLNDSDRILVEANMVRGFQLMNDINLPIWIDRAESINTDRWPKLDTQTIFLAVSDGPLTVERR